MVGLFIHSQSHNTVGENIRTAGYLYSCIKYPYIHNHSGRKCKHRWVFISTVRINDPYINDHSGRKYGNIRIAGPSCLRIIGPYVHAQSHNTPSENTRTVGY